MRHRLNTVLRRLVVTALLASVGALTFGAMNGCDNEGEGERCTFFMGGDAAVNGTSECSSGLVCTVTDYYAANVTTPGVGTLGVCCPPIGTPSTAPACQPVVGGSTTGGAPTGDGSFDAGPEAGDATTSHDAHADAAKEASASDAAHDGTSDATGDATKDVTTGG